MPYVDLSQPIESEAPAKPAPAVEQKKPLSVQELAAKTPPAPDQSPDGKKIIEFKVYLNKLGLYNGDLNNPLPDQQFILSIKDLEKTISEAINNKSIIGLIWQGNRLNPQTSVEDVENALRLIAKNHILKGAQATVDTFNMEEFEDNPPLATKFNPNRDDTGIQSGDPDESQQQGKTKEELPSRLGSMDDRIVALAKILNK